MPASEKRTEVEGIEQWRNLCKNIPAIPMMAGCSIKVIPPFGGATARFIVTFPDGDTRSVYLDHYDQLGFEGHPYWEVYPVGGDTARCALDDVLELTRLIYGGKV